MPIRLWQKDYSKRAYISVRESINMKIVGPNVVTRVYDDNLVELIKKDIASSIASGGSTKDIMILPRRKIENSALSKVNKISGRNI